MNSRSAVLRVLKAIPGLAPASRVVKLGWQRLDVLWPDRRRRRRVAQVWSERLGSGQEETKRPLGWLTWRPVVRDYVFGHFGGVNWYDYVRARYCPQPLALGLSLCCGDGTTDRQLLEKGICRACEGVDISVEAIAACRRQAEAGGLSPVLRYRVADVERVQLLQSRYDLVVGWMGLHHLRTLPHVFKEVRRSLRPDGIFLVNEYVGPARFQMPPRQLELINECLALLPDELRRQPIGQVLREYVPVSVEEVERHDPSEAVSSNQIMPLLEREFAIVERVDYGGALLQWVLLDIMQNFDPECEEHLAWLRRICDFEREAMARGEIGSDFSFVVARRRDRDAGPT